MNDTRSYQICNICVMDTSDMDIEFDEKGQCNHCRSALNKKTENTCYIAGKSEELLDHIVDKIKTNGSGRTYDCLVGISGGVDSCYVAYMCKKLGLKPLLLHFDNGWDAEIAVQNIKNVAKNLDVDYLSYVVNWQEFKEIQLAFLKSSTVDLEYPTDIGIFASLSEVAKKHKINYIISGGNSSSEGILPLSWGYHVKRDLKYYKGIVKNFSKVPLKAVPVESILGEVYNKFVKNIKTIYILNYLNYDKEQAKKILQEELGWQEYGGKHHESKITAFWQSYVMPVKYNMDYRKATFSSQICSGQLSRVEALKMLENSLPYNPLTVESDRQYIAKKFEISIDDFNKYLSQPPKTYKDFKNNKKVIDFVMNTYRAIFTKGRI